MKAVTKRWLYILIFEVALALVSIIANYADDFNQTPFFIFPPNADGSSQQAFFIILELIVPFVTVPIGYVLSPLFIRIYLWSTRRMKSMQFVGYAKYQESKREVRYHYITRLIFGALLCTNIWVILLQSNAFSFWVQPAYQSLMYDINGSMLNFPMVPWYWLPLTITGLVFAICFLILDSGLVFMKKIREHAQFADTERVGSLVWSVVKGYAGVSVIINFVLILLTPLGREASMTLYPLLAASQLIFTLATIDLLRNWGRRLIFHVIKKHGIPEIITLDYKKTPVNDMRELYE